MEVRTRAHKRHRGADQVILPTKVLRSIANPSRPCAFFSSPVSFESCLAVFLNFSADITAQAVFWDLRWHWLGTHFERTSCWSRRHCKQNVTNVWESSSLLRDVCKDHLISILRAGSFPASAWTNLISSCCGILVLKHNCCLKPNPDCSCNTGCVKTRSL